MGKILIIDQDIATIELFKLLIEALDLPYDIANTHSNAVRIYATDEVDAIFLNPELPMVDPKALMEELDGSSADKGDQRAPVVFLYEDEQLIHRYQLHALTNSLLIKRPITMEALFELLKGLDLITLKVDVNKQKAQEKIDQYVQFIQQSEAWRDQLRDRMVKS